MDKKNKPLSPSRPKHITKPQINKLGAAFAASLQKVNPFSNESQDLIENSWNEVKEEVQKGIEDALYHVLDRKRYTFTFRLKVKRGRTAEQVFLDTGRNLEDRDRVASTAPLIPGDGEEEVIFVFFKADRQLPFADVETERVNRGLVRDLEAQAQANKDHPNFSDEHVNCDSWLDEDDNWCRMVFDNWEHVGMGLRILLYNCKEIGEVDCDDDEWFGGRKL